MDAIILLLIILGVIMLLLLFLAIWEIKKRNDFSVIAHFITSDLYEERRRYKKISQQFSFKDETYFYDDKCSVVRNKNKHIFYIKGVSAPVDFNSSQEELKVKYNSKTIEKLLKNNIIQRLLDSVEDYGKKQERRIMLYIGIAVIIILFATNQIVGGHQPYCHLIGDNNTLNLIAQGVEIAIKG